LGTQEPWQYPIDPERGQHSLKAVVLCADDFAISDGVSRGILGLVAMGRLSATSAMTNCPGWPDLAPSLGEHGGRIGIGLHLTLTAGAPLGAMPEFAPEGAFPPLGAVIRHGLAGRLPGREIGAEIERQIDAFVEALGRAPDFVDGHQHVHVLPGIRRPLLDALACRGLAGRLWLRDPADTVRAIVRRGISAPKALTIRVLSAGFRQAAHRAGFATNDGFSGFSPFETGRVAAVFQRAFLDLGPRPVVMCHPGYPDDALRRLDPVAEVREQERDYLASDAFAALLSSRALALVPAPGGPGPAA
jgi:chitin disaccharide deacetylase